MNHHRPCPNKVREKMRKNYRVIRSRYVDGKLVQKILSKDSQQLQITVLGYTKFIGIYITPVYFEIRFPNAFINNR